MLSASRIARRPLSRGRRRGGASLVEMAFVLPVFGIFLAGIVELNHAYMVTATLRHAAQVAARSGVADGISSAAVEARARDLLRGSLDPSKVTVYVKDGASFDDGAITSNSYDYAGLPNIELANAKPRHLYIVRLEVDYASVALVPPFWVKSGGGGGRLTGQSVMRHE